MLKKKKNTENTEKKIKTKKEIAGLTQMNTDLKRIFSGLTKIKRKGDGRFIRNYQCKSVADFVVLYWALKKENINSVLSVVKYFGVGRGGLCVLCFAKKTKS
jgi:hypothetical protein